MRTIDFSVTAASATLLALLAPAVARSADANLLPNGDFSTLSGIAGWSAEPETSFGGIQFFATDADNGFNSGSMNVLLATAHSSCFGVVAGAGATFGGKAAARAAYPSSPFAEDPTATMSCSAYPSADCSGTASTLGSFVMSFDRAPRFAASSTAATLPAGARSANCAIHVHAVGNEFDGFQSMLLDDLFFDSQRPTSSIALDGYLSGNWYDPAQGGHGFQLEFTDQNQTLLAIWFTYAPSGGAQKWIYAQGPYALDKDTVTVNAVLLDAPAFPPQFDPATVTHTPWGTLTFTFSDCNNGTVSWNSTVPGYGSGSLPLTRLTRIAGTSCPQ